MKRLSVQFAQPRKIRLLDETISSPGLGEVLVRTLVSAISPGTELLIYRGLWPGDLPVDETIPALGGRFAYPVKYGYSTVGNVVELGAGVSPIWQGRLVFAFNPHESCFVTSVGNLVEVPDFLTPEQAAFLPNMETAVSFLMDARPIIGESVVVFGQGTVGLLTTALLGRLPLGGLFTLDNCLLRRERSLELGADAALDPTSRDAAAQLEEKLKAAGTDGFADLVFELSGNPAALDQAISVTGFAGRILTGSWYGAKRADLGLGGRFHRGRISIISSQVSNLDPSLTGRWTKTRRLGLALRMLARVKPERLITHRLPVSRAAEAYALLDESPHEAIQVMLTYEEAL